MQGFQVKKVALGLLVLGLLDLSISQPVDTESTPDNYKWMIGTEASESEIIPIHKSEIQKRSIFGNINRRFHIQLRAFGQHLKLWLEPNEGVLATSVTPVFRINNTGQIVEYPSFMNKVAGILYTNEPEAATMFITEDANGHYQLNGIIGGKGLAIRPTQNPFDGDTNDIYHVSERFRRFIEDTPEHELGNYSYHIVSKLPPVPEHLMSLKPPTLNFPRSKRGLAPQVVYPEIMVVVDYTLFKHFKADHYEVVKYVLAFWNSVDFKFRSLENPKYRLNIAGIIIAETPSALPYMNIRSRYAPYDLQVYDALTASAEFILRLEKQFRETHSFDAAITMTTASFCTGEKKCENGTVGVAYVSGACLLPQHMYYYRGKLVSRNGFKSSIVHDEGSYDGVNVAAHELGHLLGARHDGKDNKLCNEDIGNIMSPGVSITANSSDWSWCSVKDMEGFLNSQSSECLFNKPYTEGRLARFLPGKMIDVHKQCTVRGFSKAVEINEKVCVQLQCLSKDEQSIYIFQGAADGTPCAPNKICLHRQCIDISTITY